MKLVIQYQSALGETCVDEVINWLESIIGPEDGDWYWSGFKITIRNISEDDAIIFKLKFGL